MEVALRKREDILRKLSASQRKEALEAVMDVWISYEPKPENSITLSAVDGGQGTVEFQGFTLYAISAVSILYSFSAGKYSLGKEFWLADVDVLQPPSSRDRISLLREILEVKAGLLSILGGSELLLADGSLRSLLIAPRPLQHGSEAINLRESIKLVNEKFGNDIIDELNDCFEAAIKDYNEIRLRPLQTQKIISAFKAINDSLITEIVTLEYIEKLLALRKLISTALLSGKTIAYVSKRGRAQNYFHSLSEALGITLPSDIMLFNALTDEPGFSKPVIPEVINPPKYERIKWMPPVLSLDNFFKYLNVAVTYVRLSKGDPVIKVEIPVIGDRISESLIKSLINRLVTISAGGYPYPLYEVDRAARIPRSSMLQIIRGLGLSAFLTGREVLGEWIT